jgi:hypothetical protein
VINFEILNPEKCVNFNNRYFLGKCEIVAACWPAECSDMLTVTMNHCTGESLQISAILVYLISASTRKVGKLINDMNLSPFAPVIWSSYIGGM